MARADWYADVGADDDGRDWEEARSVGFVAGDARGDLHQRNTAVRFDVTEPSRSAALEFLYASFPIPDAAH